MSTITFKGANVNIGGKLPELGTDAPNFRLLKTDLSECSLSDLRGKRVVLNIFPSADTSVCAMSVRKFNQDAASLVNTVVLAVSKDLPFAQARFCTTEGIENVVPLSAFRDTEFENAYGLLMMDGPLRGLFARAVVVLDESGKVVYRELVPEIAQEPDYEAALASLR